MNEYIQNATDWNLWQEFVDPFGTITEEEFYAMSVEEKGAIQSETWGYEGQLPTAEELEVAREVLCAPSTLSTYFCGDDDETC